MYWLTGCYAIARLTKIILYQCIQIHEFLGDGFLRLRKLPIFQTVLVFPIRAGPPITKKRMILLVISLPAKLLRSLYWRNWLISQLSSKGTL